VDRVVLADGHGLHVEDVHARLLAAEMVYHLIRRERTHEEFPGPAVHLQMARAVPLMDHAVAAMEGTAPEDAVMHPPILQKWLLLRERVPVDRTRAYTTTAGEAPSPVLAKS